MVDCIHKNGCTDYPHRCSTCRYNRGKRSHYEPRLYYPEPSPWYIPQYEPWYEHHYYTT